MLYFKDCVRWHFPNCNLSQALLNCCTFCAFSNLVKTSRHFCQGKGITTKNWIHSTFIITSLVQTMKVDLLTAWFWCFEPKLIKFSISSLKIQTLPLKHHERNHSWFIYLEILFWHWSQFWQNFFFTCDIDCTRETEVARVKP